MKKTTLFAQSISSILFALTFCVHAGQEQQFNIDIPSINADITVDGELSEPVWQQAISTQLTIETSPGENTAAPVTTEVKLFASDSSLYLAFIATDPNPTQIRANLSDRDNIWGDDLVGIKLDTFNDARLAYQFFVNAYGVQLDSIENELTGDESDAWDGIWYSAGTRTDSGYQVEIKLPFRVLNFANIAEQKWGVELLRFYPRNEEHRLSTHRIDRNDSCQLCQLGVLTGISDLEQHSDVQITPSFVVNRNSQRPHTVDGQWQGDNNIEPSLDLRWGVTPNTLLSATINPDFSQVEADAGQLEINNTFALYYPEKRAFFLDNKDYFDTQLDLLHTRNIGSPDYGLKLTSKVGNHTFATLLANDINTRFLVPGNLSSDLATVEQKSQNFAGRYRYDFNKKLSIGALATAKTSDDYHNYVTSLDVKYQPNQQDTFTGQYVFSDTQYPLGLAQTLCSNSDCLPDDACDLNECGVNERVLRTNSTDAISGSMYFAKYTHANRNWDFQTYYQSVGKDFRADLGFIEKVDFNKFLIGGSYTWYPINSGVNKVNLSSNWDTSYNQAAEKLEQEAEIQLEFEGLWQSYTAFGLVNRQRVGQRQNSASLNIEGNSQMFTENSGWFYVNFKPSRTLFLELDVDYGDDIDFTNDQLGTKFVLNPGLQWNVTDAIKLDVSHLYRTMDVEDGRLFTANLSDLRLSWHLDIHNFIRVSSVYTHIVRDPNLYLYSQPNQKQKDLGNEILYGYKLNPQSVFYLGYSDSFKSTDAIASLMKAEETYFMKVSYAFIL
ncbi:carbohydrate binding family 9 domain-containing protein [Shewanella youngdeokensis]|uniref:DUF5916 domain-containing protein n=1 Tax=Shewanella youngdeokensis TaxID=2999068 RepID=A0ABZ0JVX8_9GAMM|nr:DUF5916 domain-containing protein [Shewanella sp. DAU334]